MRSLLASGPDPEEAALDELIAAEATVTRANAIAVVSPKGGVGKTTCTFLVGNVLAGTANLRCIAVDADPEFGTLGSLAPAASRVHRSLDDVFERMDRIHCAAELKPLVTTLPSGLHLIASPPALRAADALTPEHHSVLTDFLSRFYDVILFDLGTGMTGPVTRSALAQADQAIVVSTPDFVTAATVLGALHQLPTERLTMVLNQALRLPDARNRAEIERELREQGIQQHVVVPDDELLRGMLNSATYDLAALEDASRISIKRLGCCAARWLL